MSDSAYTSEQADDRLLNAWRSGDQSAAAVLFHRYVVRLTALARSRISRRLARRVDPEDVVLSAYRSFFVAAADGRIAVPDGDDLWPLLVVLVLRKVSRNAERHAAARRDLQRDAELDSQVLAAAIQDEPTPEQAAILDDELNAILSRLSPRDREIVSLRLHGEAEGTIASILRCSERTVRRALERTRSLIVDAGGLGTTACLPAGHQSLISHARRVSTTDASSARYDWQEVPYSDLRLQKLIGTGGIAKLYLARWIPEGRDVAVKFLRKRFWRSKAAVSGLLQEAEILRSLRHPQIVTLLGSGRTSEGAPYLVLPWIDGKDFEAWRRRAQPGVDEIVAAMLSVLDAVAAAHAAGIVHCDLKPSNLLQDATGGVFLTDFGFAKSINDDSRPHVRGGTAGFLAPEQCSDAFGEITVATDVYGVGATLYALLCGRPPFVGSDLPGVVAQVISSCLPPPPSQRRADVPPWLDAVILRCLAKESSERFADITQLVRHIRLDADVAGHET